MGFLQKLKTVLGMDSSGRSRQRTEPDVTVEREPSPEAERAVKTGGLGEAAQTSQPTEGVSEEPDSTGPETGVTERESSPSVEELTGIGPTYAERLEAAGIETIADLAESDLSTVVETAQTNESRAEDWLEQARNR